MAEREREPLCFGGDNGPEINAPAGLSPLL